MTIYNFF